MSTISLGKILSIRYKLENLTISKATISRALDKINPNINDLTLKHQSGIYRGANREETYYFFQYSVLDPPIFPYIKNNEAVWESIIRFDRIKVDGYIGRITQSQFR